MMVVLIGGCSGGVVPAGGAAHQDPAQGVAHQHAQDDTRNVFGEPYEGFTMLETALLHRTVQGDFFDVKFALLHPYEICAWDSLEQRGVVRLQNIHGFMQPVLVDPKLETAIRTSEYSVDYDYLSIFMMLSNRPPVVMQSDGYFEDVVDEGYMTAERLGSGMERLTITKRGKEFIEASLSCT